MNCGEKIADLRKKNGMTQDDLGKEMNVSYQAVSKWERDESQPDFETMSKIAKFFNVPLSYFEEGGELATERKETEEPKQEESKEESKQAEVKRLVGTCTECGKAVYEGEEGEIEPKLLCRPCYAKKKEEQRIKDAESEELEREIKRDERKWHRRGFLWSSLAGIAVLLIAVIVSLSDKAYFFDKDTVIYNMIATFLLPILAYAAVSRLIWFFGQADGTFDDDEPKYKIAPSMIVGAIFAVTYIAVLSVYYCSVNTIDATTFAVCLVVFALLSFVFMSQYLWGGIVRSICFAGGLVLKMPGIIFTADIGGIFFLIFVKILFGIIVMTVFLITVLICEVAALVFSVFSFVPSLIRRIKTQKLED